MRRAGHNDGVNLAGLLLLAAAAGAATLSPDIEAQIDAEVRDEHRQIWERIYPAWTPTAENPKRVVARKGVVELSLEVANTEVRTHQRMNSRVHSLWLRVSLKNIGKKPFQITDGAFQFLLALEEETGLKYEIVGEDGNPIGRIRHGGGVVARPDACPPPPSDPDWERYKPPFELAPGKTISTPASTMADVVEVACLGRSKSSPLPPYGEIMGLDFGKNKRAKIRAVYDHEVPKKYRRHLKRPLGAEEVAFATEWIELRIRP